VEVDAAFVNGCWGFIKAAKVFSREKVTSVCVRGSRKTGLVSNTLLQRNMELKYNLNYCKVLAKVIKAAKKIYYDNKITKSGNKIKTTWPIIKRETGNKNQKGEPQSLKINNTTIKDTKLVANAFNEYFNTSVAQTIIDNLNKDNNKTLTNTNPLYYLNNKYSTTFNPIKWHYVSNRDQENC
jgi:hypothetical protein